MPNLANFSAGHLFNAIVRLVIREPPTYVTLTELGRPSAEVVGAVVQWNVLREAALYRRRFFDLDELPPQMAKLAGLGDVNVVFVLRTRSRSHEYAPLLQSRRVPSCGTPHLATGAYVPAGVWTAPDAAQARLPGIEVGHSCRAPGLRPSSSDITGTDMGHRHGLGHGRGLGGSTAEFALGCSRGRRFRSRRSVRGGARGGQRQPPGWMDPRRGPFHRPDSDSRGRTRHRPRHYRCDRLLGDGPVLRQRRLSLDPPASSSPDAMSRKEWP